MSKKKKTTPPAATDKKNRFSWVKKLLLSIVSVLIFFGILEGGLRIAKFTYTPREKVAYKPWVAMRAGTSIDVYPTEFDPPGYIWLMSKKMINPQDKNTEGFHWPTQKEPGVKRIAFLGGSTTQPDGLRSYPERCIKLLNDVSGSNAYEALNCGISSYTTHQSLLALERYVLPRDPDCVVVYHGWNDLRPHQNGHSDREVDMLFRANAVLGNKLESITWLKKLKTTELLGFLMDKLDSDWPRSRVNAEEFEENLSAMAEMCAEANVPLVIVERPVTLKSKDTPYAELTQIYYADSFGTNSPDIFRGIHTTVTSAQARVAAKYPGTTLSPVSEKLTSVQQELADNPHDDLEIYMTDFMHVKAIGNQYMAETVAQTIAPELASQIGSFTNTAAYWTENAETFKTMDAPYQCSYAAEQAKRFEDADITRLDDLQRWATNQYPFMEIYRRSHWDNAMDVPLDERLAGLSQCLTMRPSDYGVAQQIHRVCQYLGRPAQAFPYLIRYQPANATDQYKWLKRLMLPAALDAKRWPEVRQVVETLLQMNPNDTQARNILNRLNASGL